MMRPRFTNAGKALQLRALAGTQIKFTKIQLGDGELGEVDYKTLTALISPKATLSLSGISIKDGSATVRGEFNNTGMTEGFYYRELGLYAEDPDNASREILYCYANFGEQCQYIAEPSSAMISRTVRIVAVVDDAPNVTAVLNDNAQYVDRDELMLAIAQHNVSETAHENLIDFDVVYYVDCTTEEDEAGRDGSESHPFRTIQEAADALPLSALRVTLYLKTGSATYTGLDDDYSFKGYQSIDVLYEGAVDTRPTIAGHLRFERCGTVRVERIAFTAAAETSLSTIVNLDFKDCPNASVFYTRGTMLAENGTFLRAFNACVNVTEFNVVSAYSAFECSGARASIALRQGTVTGGTIGLLAGYGGTIYELDGLTVSATNPRWAITGGLILNAPTADDLSSGRVHDHLSAQANPHRVTLTQAQEKGGTINVEHGGTGKTGFDSGALLKGDGTNAVGQVLGVGALFASTNGSPQFGTLPVSCGGTGRTDSGVWVQQSPTNGVLHGHAIIPGTNIVLMWGKINTAGNTTYSHDFEQYNHARFANNAYVLTFSGQDDVWGSISKTNTGFSIEVGGIAAGSYVADWIAVGVVEEG